MTKKNESPSPLKYVCAFFTIQARVLSLTDLCSRANMQNNVTILATNKDVPLVNCLVSPYINVNSSFTKKRRSVIKNSSICCRKEIESPWLQFLMFAWVSEKASAEYYAFIK